MDLCRFGDAGLQGDVERSGRGYEGKDEEAMRNFTLKMQFLDAEDEDFRKMRISRPRGKKQDRI